MIENIMNGIFPLIGVIIGGFITIYVSKKNTKQQMDLEFRKQKIEFLNSKKFKLEDVLSSISLLNTKISIKDKTENTINLLNNNSHYFINEKKFKNLNNEISRKLNDLAFIIEMGTPEAEEREIEKIESILSELNAKIYKYVQDKLGDTISALEIEMNFQS